MKELASIRKLSSNKCVCIYICMYICIVLGLSVAIAYNSAVYSDFGVVNGTFQNYNSWRRILGGQTAFKDFIPYLGVGHAFYGAIATGIFGGTFHDSIFAGTLLTCIMSFVSIFVISKCVVRSGYVASFVSLLIFGGYRFVQKVFDLFLSDLGWSLPLYGVGNSARIIRGFGLTQSIILFAIVCFVIKKCKNSEKREFLYFVGAAVISGMTIVFSNDMGVAAYITSCICVLIYTLTQKQNIKYILIRAGIWLSVSIGTFLLLTCLITGFHPQSYFEVTLGISGYQSWFNYEEQMYYLHDILKRLTFADLLSAGLSVFNIVIYCKAKDKRIENLLLAYLLLANFVRQEMYDIITGGSVRETEYITLIACICSLIALVCTKRQQNSTHFKIGIAIGSVILLFLIPTFVSGYVSYAEVNTKGGSHYEQNRCEELGGVTGYANSLYELSEQIGDDNFWTTYATAFEVVKRKYQPSGIDYIIHSLGDKTREKYVDKFVSGNYPYVLNPALMTTWEPWIMHSNWFFFQEVLKNYDYVETVGYLEKWERSATGNVSSNAVTLQSDIQPDGSVLLKAFSDNYVNGFANVTISYSVEKNENSPIIIYDELVVIYKTFADLYPSYRDHFGLPNQGTNISIPVYISDGYGEVILKSYPEGDTTVDLLSANVIELLHDPFDLNQAENVNDTNWTNGVLNGGSQMVIQGNERNRRMYIDSKPTYLELNGSKYRVTEVLDDNNGHFRIGFESREIALLFAYPAKFDILYEE